MQKNPWAGLAGSAGIVVLAVVAEPSWAHAAQEPEGPTPALEPTAPERPAPEPTAPEPPAPAPSAQVAPSPPDAPPPKAKAKLGGGAILWYYQPLAREGKGKVDVFFANLVFDGSLGAFALHLEPRFRDSKLRPFFDGPVWLQEAYASVALGSVTVKAGKIYSQLGLFWDNSFYGNVQVYDGLKLAPDYGLSVEGALGESRGLRYWLQGFVVDGGTNVSLVGRDTLSIAGAKRRNEVVAKLEPFITWGRGDELRVGVSGQYLQADLPEGPEDVLRGALHVKLTVGAFAAWGELTHQSGRHVDAFPYPAVAATDAAPAQPGRASGRNTYGLAGVEYTAGPVTLRYNASFGRYADVDVTEWMHVPAVKLSANEHVALLTELVLWSRKTPEGTTPVDESVNVTLHGNF